MIGFDGNVNRRKEEGKEGKGLQKETDILDRTIELHEWEVRLLRTMSVGISRTMWLGWIGLG